ncbi:hypothetical protein FJ971_29540 [Mesorhizobium sp. B2-1-2]|nr:hypothetical protein FJ971_29540 [Mesorhizobium sp. B2-1-2]
MVDQFHKRQIGLGNAAPCQFEMLRLCRHLVILPLKVKGKARRRCVDTFDILPALRNDGAFPCRSAIVARTGNEKLPVICDDSNLEPWRRRDLGRHGTGKRETAYSR